MSGHHQSIIVTVTITANGLRSQETYTIIAMRSGATIITSSGLSTIIITYTSLKARPLV